MFPFTLEHYNATDIDKLVKVETIAIDFELYEIRVIDLETKDWKVAGQRIVGLENISQRFNEVIEALEGAYIFEKVTHEDSSKR